jgi:hypothetical protein
LPPLTFRAQLIKFDSTSCDVIKNFLPKQGVSYDNVPLPAGSVAQVEIGAKTFNVPDTAKLAGAERAAAIAAFQKEVGAELRAVGYPASADPVKINKLMVIAIIALTTIFTAMVYGPMAAMLVELFPTRIRYTSLSLPYHIGNGWFGGLLPPIAFGIVTATWNIYAGICIRLSSPGSPSWSRCCSCLRPGTGHQRLMGEARRLLSACPCLMRYGPMPWFSSRPSQRKSPASLDDWVKIAHEQKTRLSCRRSAVRCARPIGTLSSSRPDHRHHQAGLTVDTGRQCRGIVIANTPDGHRR